MRADIGYASNAIYAQISKTLPAIIMKIERTLEKYYYLTGDEKSNVGNADPEDSTIRWDYFENKDKNFNLTDPLKFKINARRFSGQTGDYQFNSCGFLLFSDKLRTTIVQYLTDIDNPKWFPAKLTDLDGVTTDYSILHLFKKHDFLDYQKSTFVEGTDHPIKKRFDLEKIEDRLIFNAKILGVSLCVHDIVRKDIKKSNYTGLYFYKIHTAGRLS
ncbi:hypothetical protein A5893_17360 [Pedobacter psychrophilus]|uniref:Immunity MXAN-0049 protein domain-containing protein n=1 Tax=Pedobacter psychrophilus TaxID=1826909 RepID=A0A179DKG0_9SPHI|nr:DUF1629 domain-containing protein [Pedobacter psychrophilus]OAQ41458.1 hypothetical protein A5893_17360 [Pedobacter psychrophilus]